MAEEEVVAQAPVEETVAEEVEMSVLDALKEVCLARLDVPVIFHVC
jgi:hypothetical protein